MHVSCKVIEFKIIKFMMVNKIIYFKTNINKVTQNEFMSAITYV